jgi:hypothetical protein
VTLPPFLGNDGSGDAWTDLVNAVPTISALARLCGQQLGAAARSAQERELSAEAQAILVTACKRGLLEIKGTNKEFESPQRLLAVYVEKDNDSHVMFRSRSEPEITIRFLDGFCELCRAGLVIHQCAAEFSLTRHGFQVGRELDEAAIAETLELGIPV